MPKTCPHCQTEASDEAGFCSQCGGALATAGPALSTLGAQVPAPTSGAGIGPGAEASAYSFDAGRWNTADRITGVATLVLLISLFLPWFSAGVLGLNFSESGLAAHGYLYLVLLVSIAMLIYLGARAGWEKLPFRTSIAHSPAMLVASVFNLAIVSISFFLKPGGAGIAWSFGAFLAMIASVAAAAPLAVPAIQSRPINGSGRDAQCF